MLVFFGLFMKGKVDLALPLLDEGNYSTTNYTWIATIFFVTLFIAFVLIWR